MENKDYECKITKCPYCLSESGFQIDVPTRGYYSSWFNFEGKHEESNYAESMQYGNDRIPVCMDCKKPLGRWVKKID